jgi:hypothetical protein
MNSAATCGTIALPAPRNKPTLPGSPSAKGKSAGSVGMRRCFPSAQSTTLESVHAIDVLNRFDSWSGRTSAPCCRCRDRVARVVSPSRRVLRLLTMPRPIDSARRCSRPLLAECSSPKDLPPSPASDQIRCCRGGPCISPGVSKTIPAIRLFRKLPRLESASQYNRCLICGERTLCAPKTVCPKA